jgi:hypothetical protein
MPRERFDDPNTPGLYVQVNWRRAARPEDPDDPDGEGGAPGRLQISTHDERADARVLELLAEASRVVAAHTSALRSGEQDSDTMAAMREQWWARVERFRAELTGTYVDLQPYTARGLIKSLHRGRNLAFPPRVTSLVSEALSDVHIPRAGETPADGTLPTPGSTGYRLR